MSEPTTNPYLNGRAFINGDFVELSEASIPLTDAGFARSDVTYDVTSVWGGHFFRIDDHLARFERSRRELRMETLPWTTVQIREILFELVAQTDLREAYVNVTATRGTPPGSSRDPRLFTNRLYAYVCPFIWVFTPEQQERGIKAIVSEVVRYPVSSFDPTVKNYQWGDFVRGTWQAIDRNAEACILLNSDGYVTEGAGYNVFALVDGVLKTPAEGVLQGVTRRTVLELAGEHGINSDVGLLHVDELRSAEEVFFATTAGGVMPVGELDGNPIGEGGPGKTSLEIKRWYWDAHSDPKYATPVNYRD